MVVVFFVTLPVVVFFARGLLVFAAVVLFFLVGAFRLPSGAVSTDAMMRGLELPVDFVCFAPDRRCAAEWWELIVVEVEGKKRGLEVDVRDEPTPPLMHARGGHDKLDATSAVKSANQL